MSTPTLPRWWWRSLQSSLQSPLAQPVTASEKISWWMSDPHPGGRAFQDSSLAKMDSLEANSTHAWSANLSSCQTGGARPSGGTLASPRWINHYRRVLRIIPASIRTWIMYKEAAKAIYPRHVQVIKWEFSGARDNFQILQFLSKQKGPLKEHPASRVRGCLNWVYLLPEESNLTLPPGSATSPTHCPNLAASQLRNSGFGG